MKFKTFTSYDTEELDNLINDWCKEAAAQRLQVLDVKHFSCFSTEGKPFFTVSLIYQKVPEKKEVQNPCCKKTDEVQEPVIQKDGEEPKEGMIPTPEEVKPEETPEGA